MEKRLNLLLLVSCWRPELLPGMLIGGRSQFQAPPSQAFDGRYECVTSAVSRRKRRRKLIAITIETEHELLEVDTVIRERLASLGTIKEIAVVRARVAGRVNVD